ncbi:GEVED domain-containing protein [Sungkyunkwania multivorans]|uniref:GEVED domain-containing protein n=1 Tax=Sungkyunkwania multivorans TaxID=1173618 RepID=A0ABW3D2E4_9FLAO
MKKRLLGYGLLATLATTAILSVLQYNNNADSDSDIIALRTKHHNFLENSPFKETKKLSKKERKAAGLPPNKFYEREWELTMNPATGKPEPNKVLELQRQLQENRSLGRMPGDAVDNQWENRGPNNVGGRTRALLFDPNDATNRRVFAAGVSGGLWVDNDITNDGGWTQVAGVPGNLNVSCITVDPRDSNTWYLGTGEQYTFGAAVGNGVYKTTDGGTTWSNVPVQLAGPGSFDFSASNSFLAGIFYINDIIAWDNGTSTEVFIGVGAHVYGDAASPTDWLGLQSAGLYRTTNGGTNWSRIESPNMEFTFSGASYYYIPNDLEIGSDNKLWMGTIRTPGIGGTIGTAGYSGGRVYSSTNGAIWTEAAASPLTDANRVEIEPSTTSPNKLYALVQGNASPVHIYATLDGFATAPTELALPNDADNGIPADDFTRGQAFYDLVIEADPNNDNIIYVGGIDLFRSTQGPNTNLTNEWEQISKWSNNNNLAGLNCSLVHADQHAMAFRPGNSNQAIFGNDGGVYYASSLSTAENANVIGDRNTGYITTQFYYGGIGPSASTEYLLAGAQDNGSQFINGASAGINSSLEVTGGDGAYSTIDKDGNYMITSYVYNVHYYRRLPYTGAGYTIQNNQSEGDFINQAGLDHNLNIMYANGTFETTYRINRYTLGNNSATKAQLTNALLDAAPTAFEVSPYTTASSTLLVGTSNGKLLRLTNAEGTPNWTNITGGSFLGSISDIEFGTNENEIFVTFHNYGVTNVWYTSNGGTTWSSKEGDLPDMPVKAILQNPFHSNEVIIGTELGVWATSNFDSASPNWVQSYNGMSDVKVMDLDLRASDNAVLATTFGRGMFTGQFLQNTSPDFTLTDVAGDQAACNTSGTTATFEFTYTVLNGFSETTTFSATGLPAGATINFTPSSTSTTQNITAVVSNLDGTTAGAYPIQITGTASSITKNLNVNLQVLDSNFGALTLSAPADGATNVFIAPTVSWVADANAESYDVEIASDPTFDTIVETGSNTINSYTTVAALQADTTYYWRVTPNNSCGIGTVSSAFSFTTETPSYCASTFSQAVDTDEYIDGVTFGTINNQGTGTTNGVGYTDFTNLSTDVNKGDVYTLTVTVFANYNEYATVWFDWNRDYQFTPDERTDIGFYADANGNVTRSVDITIPTNAVTGATRMRVTEQYNENVGGPCTADHNNNYGETEDYTINILPETISLQTKAFLQGAMISSVDNNMTDTLRANGLIPTTSPYADGATCNSSVFSVTGNDAIVDWVWVELRSATDREILVDGVSALIQRDGDIVATDGTSILNFTQPAGNYYLVISHRTHLNISSTNTHALSKTANLIDLSAGTAAVIGGSNAVADLGNGSFAMFAGDQDINGQIQNTDVSSIRPQLGTAGYSNSDLDMNGQVQLTDINNVLRPNIGKGQQF